MVISEREVSDALRDADVAMHRLEARLLCEHAQSSGESIDALLSRRLGGEPIAYITGEWEFYSLPIRVTRDTLIPRADTETLAERAIEWLRERKTRDVPMVLDLCSGTGCIGLAIAANVPSASVTLGELSDGAIEVCRENIALNGLGECVAVQRLNALGDVDGSVKYDLIVSNPPYIRAAEMATLDASVREFEPRMALDGGDDGLMFYRAIAKRWRCALKTGGRLMFEVGYDQAEQVAAILRENGYENIAVTRDLSKIERVIEGEKRNG